MEKIINDRPISELPSSPDDPVALTPSMLLTGSIDDSASPGEFLRTDGYRRSWKKCQYLADRFWERWLQEYLPLLQPRSKWFGKCGNIQKGDIVLVVNERVGRGCWPMAVVEEVFPDRCGLVRRVSMRTADGKHLMRDIRKICLLEGRAD